MIYIAGIIGFILGFIIGLMLLSFLLNNVSKKDMLDDPYIKWKYGSLNWIIAILGSYIATIIYERIFL